MTEAIFITIPLSHYCEKARWGLDRAWLPYREDPHVPLLSRLATRRNEGGTVPLLVHAGLRLAESRDILVHADEYAGGDLLYPRDAQLRRDVDALEARFDRDLGTHVRRWVYWHLLPEKAILHDLWGRGAPRREAFFLPLLAPIARKLLPQAYKLTPDGAARSLNLIREMFREVGELLRDGRHYFVGDRFTAADLTFAALAAPVIFPECCRAVLPELAQVPAAMRAEIERLRESAAGEFVQRLYAAERQTTAPTSPRHDAPTRR